MNEKRQIQALSGHRGGIDSVLCMPVMKSTQALVKAIGPIVHTEIENYSNSTGNNATERLQRKTHGNGPFTLYSLFNGSKLSRIGLTT